MASARSLLFVFATFLFWFFLLTAVDAQDRSQEVQALLSFKAASSSLGDYNSIGYWSSWKETDQNACTWVGVTCTANYTVVQLDLSGWGLAVIGSLGLLSNLTDLRYLDISSNSLGNLFLNWSLNIVLTIQALTGLTHLNLANNGFPGIIPASITQCTNLQYISLADNQLDGTVPSLLALVNLQVLLLANNLLSGPFPTEFGEMSSLVKVDLSGNMFNGTIPFLSNSGNLLDLILDNNMFTDFKGPLFPAGADSLQRLSVSRNQLAGAIPTGIQNLRNLKYLDMSGNQLSGTIPSGIKGPINASFSLDLSQNQLTGNIPPELVQPLEAISVRVNLSYNLLYGRLPLLDAAGIITSLDLSHNNLSGNLPSSYISSTTEILWLQNNFLSGDIVEALAQSVSGDNFSDPVHVELRLQNNNFSGDLSRLTKFNNVTWTFLQVVDLSNNNLQMSTTEGNPDPMRAILEIFMSTWEVSSSTFNISSSPSLIECRMGGNNFSGASLPSSFGTRNNILQVLDLSNNHLKGEISGAAFNSTWFPSLQALNLSNNDVSGTVSKNIVLIPNLTSLDLTNNSLSGLLPFIPKTSKLYNPLFFLGNTGLCGDPLPPCPTKVTGVRVQNWMFYVAGGLAALVMGSCLAATWQWGLYRKRHHQDADLIKTLLERESASLMPLRELKKATKNFAKSAEIGEGGFGTVYKGQLDDGTVVAIKRSKRKEDYEKDKEQFLNEVKILSRLNHRYLVKLLGCCMENKIALLVFEFVSNGTLEEHLRGKRGETRLSWKQRLNIAVQTADALNYLHSSSKIPIYHRDVKSANILLDGDLNAKVADFGISKLAPTASTHVSTMAIQGTIGYIDPEYYTRFQFTSKSDVYSFGVVLLELISAKPAIDFLRDDEETSLVIFAKPIIQSEDLQQLLDPALMETYTDPAGYGRESILNVGRLALKCLNLRSKPRPTMNDVGRELEKLLFEISDGLEDVGYVDGEGDGDGDFQRNHSNFLSEFYSFDVSRSLSSQNDATETQMTEFSHLQGED